MIREEVIKQLAAADKRHRERLDLTLVESTVLYLFQMNMISFYRGVSEIS